MRSTWDIITAHRESFVEDSLAEGQVVILEIEVQGAMKIKEQYPDAILLFITAPSIEVLKNRLVGPWYGSAGGHRKTGCAGPWRKPRAYRSTIILLIMKKESWKTAWRRFTRS